MVWNEMGKDATDSMPTGNGDIGVNVWTEENGDLLVYIGKTDAWDENCRLLKLGKIRIRLTPAPFGKGQFFRQTLRLRESEIQIKAEGVSLRIWVDANHPIVCVEGKSEQALSVSAILEPWRSSHPLRMEDKREGRTKGGSDASHSEHGLVKSGTAFPVTEDQIPIHPNLVWYHRNEGSVWKGELTHQGLSEFAETAEDPLLNRTFGGMLYGDGFRKTDCLTVQSRPAKEFSLSVCLVTAQTDTVGEWIARLEKTAEKIKAIPAEERRAAHLAYWKAFWERSHIHITANGEDKGEAYILSRAWHLQRYTIACAGRGEFPLKFNGSIFNVDGNHSAENPYCLQGYDADFRAWGGCYWFQNQRQIYWAMLASGDFDEMLPFFRMYKNALPYARHMTRSWFGHEGAFFPETMHFWGGYSHIDYGMTPASEKDNPTDVESGYVKRYWQGGLELLFMMLEYYRYTGDQAFFQELLRPVGEAVLTFYACHYPKDASGKMLIYPAQCLETIWDAVNPLPEIAGIRAVCRGLMESCTALLTEEEQGQLHGLLGSLPALSIREKDGEPYLDCCDSSDGQTHNQENISMYAVFPYRLFGMGKEGLEMLRHTFSRRQFDENYSCWHNNNVFAAYLGLSGDARKLLAKRALLHHGYRFPSFYTDGDWVPDHDNGGVIQQTLQAMLLQDNGEELLLFPAFPENWDVEFKLHTSGNATVEGCRKNGTLERLAVAPDTRMKDIKRLDTNTIL